MVKLKSKGCASGLVLTLVFILCSSVAQAQDYGSRIRNIVTDRAYRQLLHANLFNLGGAGFALAMTTEEKAFRVLLKSANSVALFQQLLRESNPEGQIYALYGLYLQEPSVFQSEAERLKNDDGPPPRWEGMISVEKGKIRFAKGCIISRQDRRGIIERMAKGDFDSSFKALSANLKH